MTFRFFLRSLRSQLFGVPSRTNRRRKGKRPAEQARLRRLRLEALEDRTLLTAAPAPLIQLQQAIATSFSTPTVRVNFDSPAISVDPTDPSKMAAVYIEHVRTPNSDTSDAVVLFSTNGGTSWSFAGTLSPDLNPGTAPNLVPFPYITNPSIGFDHNNHFYVLFSEHTAAIPFTDGQIVLYQFDFANSSPARTGPNSKVYAWDLSLDPAYNPTLAVDSNAPIFADPQNGATQTDPASGSVYVAFNINYTPPQGVTNVVYSDTVMRISTDGGKEFGGLVSITANQLNGGVASTTGPAIVVAQGTNSGASNSVAGGSVNVAYSEFDPTTPTNASSIFLQNFPRAPSSYTVHGGAIGTAVTLVGTLTQFSTSVTGLTGASGLVAGDQVIGGIAFTGTLTAGSKVVTNMSSMAGIKLGQIVTGASIPGTPPTTITFVDTATSSITLSQAATTSGPQTLIIGTGGAIQPNTIVTAVNSATSITLSNPATASGMEPLIFVIPGISAGNTTMTGVVGVSRAGDTTNASAVVMNLSKTSDLVVGETVAGPGIAANTTIKSIDSPSQITLSGNATATATGVLLTFGDGPDHITMLPNTLNLAVGDPVTGTGIVSGTIVSSIVSNTEVMISKPQDGTALGRESITFGKVQAIADAGPGTPNQPVTTNFTALVNINPLTAPAFTTVSNLSLNLKIIHAHLDQVQILLIAPDGTTFTVLQNHVDQAGNTSPGVGLNSGVNLGIFNGIDPGTVLDDGANRLLTDQANKDPHIGVFVPEYTFGELHFSDALDGLLPSDPKINGVWTLSITDFRNDSTTVPPVQKVVDWSLNFTSNLDTGLTNPSFAAKALVGGAYPTNTTGAPYPIKPLVAPDTGVGPGIVIAQDNTLGGYSPYQGRIYLAYVQRVVPPDIPDDGNIMLMTSDNGGFTWSSPTEINDDSAFDGFSQGNRTQFMPELAVDPANGNLVVSYFDARNDAANARVVRSIAVSVDGGQTFSPWQQANPQQTAINAITGETVNQEPLPDNQGSSNPNRDNTQPYFSFGSNQGLAAVNGHLYALWAGNQNLLNHPGSTTDPQTLNIYETVAGYAAGPRIISSTQGPVAGSSLETMFAPDGQQLADRFEVLFDRPVDPDTFKVPAGLNDPLADVKVFFRSPTMPLTQPGIQLPVLSVTPEDFGPHGPAGAFGATRFLVIFDPARALSVGGTYTGTYSYAVGPHINDRIRSAPNGVGNNMDQNANGTPDQANVDRFAAPRSVNSNLLDLNGVRLGAPYNNGVPFTLPYDTDTLPLIVAGPHIISTYVPGFAPSGDNLLLNGTTNVINVVFDRDIDPTSFPAAEIQRIIGPLGPIDPSTVTVTPDPVGTPAALAKRTFQIHFPTQTLSGSYSILLGPNVGPVPIPTIKALNNGDKLDTNLNAGLDVLRGGATVGGTNVPVTFNDDTLTFSPLTIGPKKTVTATLNINNPFIIQGLTTKLSISAANDPDLEAILVHPDGTQIKLFTNVGGNGPLPHSDFTNTVFDDFASTPIQDGRAPFNIGSFNPQIPLSRLKNKSSAGTWQLIIKNDANSTNTLTAWSLTLFENIPGTGLGEPLSDQSTVHFRIFTQAPDNVQSQTTWTPVGGASNNGNHNSGRIGGIAIDPSDPSGNTVYVAGASGGVWKTTNFLTNDPSGPTYIPIIDFSPIYGLNIGSIAVFGRNRDPRQSIVVVGTGEGDALAGGGGPTWLGATSSSHGIGFLISKDGGNTWDVFDSTTNVDATGNVLPITDGGRDHVFRDASVFKVLVDPKPEANGQTIMYAAVSGGTKPGVWRSLDTGKHWTLMRAGNATDLAFANGSANGSSNLQIIYAGFQGDGVYESPNQGSFWNKLLGNVGDPLFRDIDRTPSPALTVGAPRSLPSGAFGRIVLVTPANIPGNPLENTIQEGYLYAGVASTAGGLQGLYLTRDFGQNWTEVPLPIYKPPQFPKLGFPTNDNLAPSYDPLKTGQGGEGGQGNYDFSLAVDPTNRDIIYVGGTFDGQPFPVGGLLRVDTTLVRDAHNLTPFNSHRNDSGLLKLATLGSINLKNPNKTWGIFFTEPPNTPFFDLIRDPDAPFKANNTLFTTNITGFNNDGFDIRWMPFNDIIEGTTDQHRVVTMVDPLTGHARLIFGDDQGIFSGIDSGDGSLMGGIGTDGLGTGIDMFATGTRNGNLQITQNYYGAVQPSILAAQVAAVSGGTAFVPFSGGLFYGSAQDNGFPISDANVLQSGQITWTGPGGDGMGVATDQTGSGTWYNFMWPCCNIPLTGPFASANDFFVVSPAFGASVGRTFGLILGGDDPFTGTGEWPNVGGSNFAVNSIDPNGIVMSAFGSTTTGGRIFRTQDQGRDWFVIGDPTDLDSSYAPAVAFGAPHTSDLGNFNNFIYAGTLKGEIFVTTQGGGTGINSTWMKVSNGLDGSPIQQIVTNPKRDSNEAYAVTLKGVYHLQLPAGDLDQATWQGATWTPITGNLFSITHVPVLNRTNDSTLYTESMLQYLSSIQADWRFATPTAPPILYVGGEGGVFRSTDGGANWFAFPDVAHQGAKVDGGYLPSAHITALSLSTGNIDPATGLPKDASTGFNLLLATTYGHGSFAIRLSQPLPASAPGSGGPVLLASHITDASNNASEALTVEFGKVVNNVFVPSAVDPTTFSPSDIVLKDPSGNVITVQQVIDVTPGGPSDIHNIYRLIFNSAASGNYSISIGPNVTDFSGDKMTAFTGTVAVHPLAPTKVSLPYTDSFNGNYGDPLPRQWLNGPGYFNIQSSPIQNPPNPNPIGAYPVTNFAIAKAGGTNVAVLQLTALQSSASVQADVNVTTMAGSNAGLVARYVNVNNYYIGELQNIGGSYYATIAKVSGGVTTTLVSKLLGTSVGFASGTLRFDVLGVSLKLYLNGNLIAFAQDASVSANGTVGFLGTQGTTFANFSSNVLSLQNATLPFSDNFNQTGSQLSTFWQDRAGNITVVNNKAVGNGSVNLSTVNGVNAANVTVSGNITVTGTQFAGLVARYGGPLDDNWYWGELQGNGNGTFTAFIYKKVNGVQTLLAKSTTTVGTGSGTLEFDVSGSSLKLFFNNSLVANALDASLSSGSVGMRISQGAMLDNFQADVIPFQTTTLPFDDDFSTTTNGNQLDAFWSPQSGNITVTNGQATGSATGINLATLNTATSPNDALLRADLTLALGQSAGLVARFNGPLNSNYYLGLVSRDSAGFHTAIWKNINGLWTQLATGKTVGSLTGPVEFEAVGPSLKLIMNGQLLAFADDTSLKTGSVGFRLNQGAKLDNFHAEAVAQLTPSLPFSDDFSSTSDASQLDRNWTDQKGNITVVGGVATGKGASGASLSTVNGLNQADVAVKADVALLAGQTVGLVARYQGALNNNYYFGQLSSTSATSFQASIWKIVGGTATELIIGKTVSTGTGKLEFETVGTSLKLIFTPLGQPSQLLVFGFDGSLKTGSVGMRLSTNATADNFNAVVGSQTASLPFSDNFSSTGDASQLSSSWTDRQGNVTVVNGQATGTVSGTSLSTVNGINATNVTVSAFITALTSGQTVGLVARYNAASGGSYYFAQVSSTSSGIQASIWKRINGVNTLLKQVTASSGTGTLTFSLSGSSLHLAIGSTMLDVTDSSLTGSGPVGMRLSLGAALDNFSAS